MAKPSRAKPRFGGKVLRKGSLLRRKRGTDPQRTRRAYMQSLIARTHAEARKRDRKAYDAYWNGRFAQLFPG